MKLTLEKWAAAQYGESAPCIVTLRRWARDGMIHPAPEKHGREWFVESDARYVKNKPGKLVRRLYGTTPPRPQATQLAR